MRKVLSTAAFALCPALSGSAALAQAPAIPPFNWTGAYAGAHAGVLHLRTSTRYCWFVCSPWLGASDTTGIAGFQSGYNQQFGSLVLGFETDIGFTQAATRVVEPGFGIFEQTTRLSALGTTRVRGGYASGDALFFLTAGAAYGRLSVTPRFFGIPDPARNWKIGFTFGGGVEYALTRNWFLKADVLYFDLGRIATSCNGIDCGKFVYNTRTKVDGYVVRAGLNYRFGAPAGAAVAQY
jgi:outer membrane immunogenic protein